MPRELQDAATRLTVWFRVPPAPEAAASFTLASATGRPLPGEVVFRLNEEEKRRGHWDLVLAHYQELLRTEPDFAPVMHWTGRLLGTGAPPRDLVRGEQLARRACDLTHWQHLWPLYSLAEVLMSAHRWDEALSTIARARRIHPRHTSVIQQQARCLLGAARMEVTPSR